MLYTFGFRDPPCGDCWLIDGQWYCTMNCGPAVPQESYMSRVRRDAALLLTLEELELLIDAVKSKKGSIAKVAAKIINVRNSLVREQASAMTRNLVGKEYKDMDESERRDYWRYVKQKQRKQDRGRPVGSTTIGR